MDRGRRRCGVRVSGQHRGPDRRRPPERRWVTGHGRVRVELSLRRGLGASELALLAPRQPHRTLLYRTRVPGVRYGPERPVYVLTSRRTFSGAEEFAYNLQTQQRAVIVGDTTGGGAHPGGLQRVTDHFGLWVPTGRAINPITKTNWERMGVRPDVAVSSDQALRTAQLAALRGLRERATDSERRRQLDEAIAEVEARR